MIARRRSRSRSSSIATVDLPWMGISPEGLARAVGVVGLVGFVVLAWLMGLLGFVIGLLGYTLCMGISSLGGNKYKKRKGEE